MKLYRTKVKRITGRHGKLVYNNALNFYKAFVPSTKRHPYIRSKYFHKEKVFLDLFWNHLRQKRWKDKVRRLRFLPCALELVRESTALPVIKQNPERQGETLYRFFGVTPCGSIFVVQIKQDKKSGRKYLMSVFPK